MITHNLPKLARTATGFQLHVGGQATILLAGELHNSSAASATQIEPMLDRLQKLNLNCVLAPVSWELVEPEEGRFDFTLLDALVLGARKRGLMLVPLWFGTMKNAISCYTPPWVKTDLRRFFRAQEKSGISSWTISVFCEDAVRCDASAFAAVMRRIGQLDPAGQTVPLVQVENETGMLNAPRDLCPAALAAFEAEVPAELPEYLSAHETTLQRELAEAWRNAGRRMNGSWSRVFGTIADEVFMAWHVARFVDQVAAMGMAAHRLPMFANAWLINGPGFLPGQYPSGGPVPKVLDVWKCASPHIDAIAPDIYAEDFRLHSESYSHADNALLIPEARNDNAAASRVLYAIGKHGALMFSPFAIDDLQAEHPLAATYKLLGNMLPMLAEHAGNGKTTGFLQQSDEERFETEFGGYRFRARTRQPLANCRVPGGMLLMHVGPNEFIAVGRNMILTFEPLEGSPSTAEIVWLDAGDFHEGRWRSRHRLNGDETAHGTGVLFAEDLLTVRFVLHAYR